MQRKVNGNTETNRKLEQVDLLDSDKASDYRKLVDLIRDDDEEVRYFAIERIGFDRSRETTELILGALDDSDELVRVQCLDELAYRNDLTAEDAENIRFYLNDESELVRCYAASALAAARDVSVIAVLTERLARVSTREQASYCFALVALGKGHYLEKALELLGADCYHTRCCVANSIVRYIDDSNRDRIVASLEKTLETETTRAVSSTIESRLKEIAAHGG